MTVDELFDREYARLVRSLGVAFEAEAAADAVQEGSSPPTGAGPRS